MSLVAYHLPLDRHPELGNNALAARAFGLDGARALRASTRGCRSASRGASRSRSRSTELRGAARAVYGQEPLALPGRPGAGARPSASSAAAPSARSTTPIAAGLDAYITGEASEWVMNVAREAGIHYLAAGHYATERLGIRALGEHLAERFGLEVEFIDVPNPV